MSMNGHAKRTIECLLALGFNHDDEASRTGVYVYRHPNAPDQVLRVFSGISEMAAKKVRIKAADLAGMSSAGEAAPKSVAMNARIKRQEQGRKKAAEVERHNRELAPFQAQADERARRLREADAIERQERHRRDMASLMMPGRGRFA